MPTMQRLGGDDDVDSIPPTLLNGVGVVTLLVILFYGLMKEHIVTGAAHRREVAAKDDLAKVLQERHEAELEALSEAHEKRVADKDAQIVMWRAVGETSQAQMTETLEHSRLSVQLLQAIEARAKKHGQQP